MPNGLKEVSFLSIGMQIKKHGFLILLFLFFSFTTLYFVVSISLLKYITNSSNDFYNIAYVTFNFVSVATLFVGSLFIKRFNTLNIIYECLIVLSVITPILIVSNVTLRLVIIYIQGILVSLGQLSSLKYFWTLTVLEERGRVAGFAGFFVLPLFQLSYLITQNIGFNEIISIITLICIVALAFTLFETKNKFLLTRKKDEEGQHHEKKTIFLYTLPWILFSLVNITLERNVSYAIFELIPSSFHAFLLILQVAASGFGALTGGLTADLIGRRSALGISLTLYGISIILGGFAQIAQVLYFHYIMNGLTWGILWALYGFVIWGDLGSNDNVTENYSMGLMIIYFVTGIGFLLRPQLSQFSISTSSLLGCLLVLLSNIPIIMAPELLSKDFRDKIKLRLFVNTLKRIRK